MILRRGNSLSIQTSQEPSSFLILGGGQHAFLIAGLAAKQGLVVSGWVDKPNPSKFVESSTLVHYKDDSEVFGLFAQGVGLIPGIASHKLWKRRRELLTQLKISPKLYPNISDARAMISETTKLGFGNQLIGNCFVQDFTQIGNWSIINSGSVIEHDSHVGDYVHIAPGVTICGGVSIGSGSFIGAGSTIVEGVTIGKNVLIGAGSLVLKDVPEGELQFGIPSVKKGHFDE